MPKSTTPPTHAYRVYVIRLKSRAWKDSRKLRKHNPGYVPGKPLAYVGSTAKSPEQRFQDHKSGGRTASKLAHRYGTRLMSKTYRGIRARASRRAGEKREARLAEQLRARGWGVWQR